MNTGSLKYWHYHVKNDALIRACTDFAKRDCAGDDASEGLSYVVGDVQVDKVEEQILLQAVAPSPACDWDTNELDACIEYQSELVHRRNITARFDCDSCSESTYYSLPKLLEHVLLRASILNSGDDPV